MQIAATVRSRQRYGLMIDDWKWLVGGGKKIDLNFPCRYHSFNVA
jgi:hypothetical protein